MYPEKNIAKNQSNISQLWMECCKRDLLNDLPTQTALEQLKINPVDQKCLKYVQDKINAFDKMEMLHPEPFRKTNPNQENNISGSIQLGKVHHTKADWGLGSHDLSVHVCVLGRNGGGKTTVIKHILRSLLEREQRDSGL